MRVAIFCGAVLASNAGNGLFLLGVSMVLFDRTGSASTFGLVLVGYYMSRILLQPAAGYLADRFSPLRVMVVHDMTLAMLLLPLATIEISTPLLVSIALVALAGDPFYKAATFKFGPQLVNSADGLRKLNSWKQVATQAGAIGGAWVLGVVDETTAQLVLGANGLSFLLASILLAALSSSFRRLEPARASSAAGGRWADTVRLIRSGPLGLQLLSLAHDGVLFSAVNLLMVPLVSDAYGEPSERAAFLSIAFAIGFVAGSMTTRVLSVDGSSRDLRSAALVARLPLFVGLAFAGSTVAAIPIMFMLAAVAGWYHIIQYTRLQEMAPEKVRGRIGAALSLVVAVSGMCTALLVGPLADRSIPLAATVVGLAVVMSALPLIRSGRSVESAVPTLL